MNRKTSAARCLWLGLLQLKRPTIRALVLTPLVINGLLYAAALWVAIHYFSVFLHGLLPQWLDFLQWVLWPVFGLIFLVLVSFTFTLAANILGAPFYAVLAERLLAEEGLPAGGTGSGLVKSAAYGMWVEARRVGGYLRWAVPFLLLFLVPGLNVVAPLLWLVFSAWFLARDYFSYAFDALGLSYAEQQRLLRSMRTDRLIFGVLVQFGLSVPLLNVLISPAAVAGATRCLSARLKSR